MANQFQGISSGLAELKNFYEGPIVDQFSEDLPIHRAVEKVKKGWSGYQVIRPLRVRRNQGIGATSDGGPLPAIGRQTSVQASFQSAFNYLRFGVTGPMIKASASDVASFVRSASYELEEGYADLKNDCNRQYSWDGTGTLATVNTAAAASTTLVIAGRESVEAALKFVDVGLVFDLYTSAGTLVASSITVNSISTGTPSSATATLVLSAPVTTSATDVLVRANSYGYEIKGLLYALDGGTTSIYGVDRSTYISVQGNSLSLSGNQLKLDSLAQAYNAGISRGGEGGYDALYSDFDSLRYYQKLLTVDKRYSNTIKGDGGFAQKDKYYLDYNSTPWVPDKDCPQRIFMIPAKVLKNYILSDMEFADETGSMYIAQTGVDQLECRVRFFSQLFNEKPSSCSVVKSYISP